jgi:flagellar basal body-associated protein FliL
VNRKIIIIGITLAVALVGSFSYLFSHLKSVGEEKKEVSSKVEKAGG